MTISPSSSSFRLGSGHPVRLVAVPSFMETGIACLVDLTSPTLETSILSFAQEV